MSALDLIIGIEDETGRPVNDEAANTNKKGRIRGYESVQ
jgi:hypothetical protein